MSLCARTEGTQEALGTPDKGRELGKLFRAAFQWPEASSEDMARCFSGLRLPWVQGLVEGAVGDWSLAAPKRTV